MKVIVCDAGPIIHLYEAKVLKLLKKAGSVYIPDYVYREAVNEIDLARSWPNWLQIIQLTNPEKEEAKFWAKIGDFHYGESEAFVLARKMNADWLLTDDAAARFFASLSGIEVHGSLGLVLWNAAQRYIKRDEAEKALTNLKNSSLWLSTAVYSEARQALQDMGL